MWTHRFEYLVDLNPHQLWPVLADVPGWPAIDHNIDWLHIADRPDAGARFTLKPKGGPALKFTIGRFEPPHIYSDVCELPFARMETTHRLSANGAGTLICVDINISGPLAPVWGRLVGRKHASGLPAQTQRFVAAARESLALA